MRIYFSSIAQVTNDMVITPTAQFAWAHGYFVAQRLALPAIIIMSHSDD